MDVKNSVINQALENKTVTDKLMIQGLGSSESSLNYNKVIELDFARQSLYSEKVESIAILPAFNLQNIIGDIVKRTKEYVDHVIVVSDGSSDDTNLNAIEAGAKCPLHTCNIGKGYAIRKGIEYSKRYNPKYIVLMDSDGQHLPEEIPHLLQNLKNNTKDVVIGSRFKGILKTSLINRFGNTFLNILSFIMTGRWFSDIESGFRAFISEKLYKLNLETEDYKIDIELLLKSLHKGFRIVEVPITITKAIPGITLLDGVKVALYTVKKGFIMNLRRLNFR